MKEELKKICREDFQVYQPNKNYNFANRFFCRIKYPTYNFLYIMRKCNEYNCKKLFHLIYRVRFRNVSVKLGIQIPYYTKIGGGIYIPHYNGIVIHGDCVIGKNLKIRQNVTIGATDKGVPVLGDNVTIGAGAILIGPIKIGNNVTIGAGSVVTKSFSDNSVIAGNPAKLISKQEKI